MCKGLWAASDKLMTVNTCFMIVRLMRDNRILFLYGEMKMKRTYNSKCVTKSGTKNIRIKKSIEREKRLRTSIKSDKKKNKP